MVILNYNNISQYYCFSCIFYQINAALVSIKYLNEKTRMKSCQPKLANLKSVWSGLECTAGDHLIFSESWFQL